MPGGSKFLPFSPFLLSLSVFLSLPLPFLSPLPPFFPLVTSPLVILFPFFSLFFLFFTLPSPDIARDQRSNTRASFDLDPMYRANFGATGKRTSFIASSIGMEAWEGESSGTR